MNVYQLSQRHGLNAPLIAVIAVCALWLGYVAGWGERAPSADVQPIDQAVRLEDIRLAPDYPLSGAGPDLGETAARPLFTASRRPSPGAAQSGSIGSSALPRGRYTLTGVSISQGKRMALLRDAATSKTIRVEQGSDLSGILVESVAPTKVVLKLRAEREELALSVALAPKVATVTPTAADRPASRGQAGEAGAPPAPNLPPAPAPPAAAALPGMPKAAADIANSDPITDADVAERAARVQARRNRQSASGERVPR